MAAISISRMVVPSLALVATSAAALVLGITYARREPPVEIRAPIAAAAVSPPASDVRYRGSVVAVTGQSEANIVAAELSVSPSSPVADGAVPVFDIARIEQTGDAVIAGTAAPGAIVELLRNGEQHDRAVANPSGQFVMVPPRLPPGNYELTLRSKLPDGTLATSKQSVVVALDAAASSSGALQSHAEMPFNVPATTGPNGLRQEVALSQMPHTTAAAPLPDGGSSSTVVERKISTTVVSRGDSLWRISRVTYGAGTRYAVVYRANRDRIQDPNRIYPGQIFILPTKAR